MHNRQTAFTLIELLVVVTIIVVLLALLTPALDKAIYQAELAACSAQLDATATAVVAYAMNHKRNYPYRPMVRGKAGQLHTLYDGNLSRRQNDPGTATDPYDDRRVFKGYIDLKLLVDPLSGELDLADEATDDDAYVLATYNLWFGAQYKIGGVDYAGMFKIGNRLTWKHNYGDGRGVTTHRFNTLVTDRHFRAVQSLEIQSSHPDPGGVMSNYELQNETYDSEFAGLPQSQKVVWSFWRTNATSLHGPMDLNFGYDDGSVRRLSGLEAAEPTVFGFDDRLAALPTFVAGSFWRDYQTYLPRQ